LESHKAKLVSELRLREKWDPPFWFDWSNKKLWALDLPIQEIHIKRLSWIAFKPIWSTQRGQDLRDLAPYDVIKHPELFPVHYKRVLDADQTFPIDCMWIRGRLYILDGVHRLIKHLITHNLQIQIRRVKKEHVEKIQVGR
jgi:hypothetical protein